MRRARFLIVAAVAMAGMSFVALPAYAQDAGDGNATGQQDQGGGNGTSIWDVCDTNGGSAVCAGTKTEATDIVKNIINLLLFALGITAVGLIIHSGLKYTTSRGDPGNIKSAKDTLLYAVVGLVVASLAFVIVNFVVNRF